MRTFIAGTVNAVRTRMLLWGDRLGQSMDDSLRYARPNVTSLAAVGVVGQPAYYALWTTLFPDSYENLPLRLTASAVALPGVLYNRLPAAWERYMSLYWWVSLSYILVFFFTLMLLQSSQWPHEDAQVAMVWPLSSIAAIAVLTMLIQEAMLVFLSWGLGTAFAWGVFLLTQESIDWAAVQQLYLAPLPVYLFLLIMGAASSRSRKMVQAEMLRAAGSVGASIAHELRTPLMGIRTSAQGLRDFIPDLVKAYELAQQNDLNVRPIRRRHLATLTGAIDNIDHETQYSNQVIDMLLINSGRSRVDSTEFRVQSARTCIEMALQRYPFTSEQERGRVRLTGDADFAFYGSDILMTHVVFNLVKNALYFVASSEGEVTIHLEAGEDSNRMVCWDNGEGIPDRIQPRIFDSFYTSHKPGRGTGIGLAFCRMVMDGFGGSIKCRSVHGEFTEFTLIFPLLSQPGATR